MAKLSEEHKVFVVQRLAMFDTPSQVVEAVKEEYGIEIPRQQVQSYDPTVGPKPAKKWIALFEATRESFLDSASQIPIANRSVRLRRLERMAVAAEGRKNYALAAQLLEQAAKEVGEAYTNTRNIKHSGGVVGGVLAVPVPISDEQWAVTASSQQAELLKRPASASESCED